MREICAVFFTFQQCNAPAAAGAAAPRDNQPPGTTDTSPAFISPHIWHQTTQI